MGFGLADHAVSVDVLKLQFPEYSSITFSNDGY
jgi:phosphohistidine phosphatase